MAHASGNATWTNTTATPIDMVALENIENGLDAIGPALPGQWTPSDNTLFAWSADPMLVGRVWFALGGGVFHHSAVKVATTQVCTGCVIGVGAAGAGLTAGQSVVALYNAAGTQVAITADQSSNWTTTGAKQIPWVTPFTIIPGTYWAGILSNGTTPASIMALPYGNGHPMDWGLTATTWRTGTSTGVTTTIPSTRPTPTSSAADPLWVGLY